MDKLIFMFVKFVSVEVREREKVNHTVTNRHPGRQRLSKRYEKKRASWFYRKTVNQEGKKTDVIRDKTDANRDKMCQRQETQYLYTC